MDEGWTRWLLETYAFAVDTLHDADIQTADLTAYHAIVLPNQGASRILGGHTPGTMPDEYVGGLGLEGLTRGLLCPGTPTGLAGCCGCGQALAPLGHR